jgi:phage RecT family recombinase
MSVQRISPPSRNVSQGMVALIEEARPRFATVATRYLSEDKLCALAMSMWGKDSRLRQCSPKSFLLALYKACQLGLDPTGIGNQGHIVAYRGEAQFIRGWGGVITMAARRGIKIDTFAVYESDDFEVGRYVSADGYHLGLHHVEKRDNVEAIGNVRAAYAIATSKDWEQPMIEVVWSHDIEKIRKNSASPSSPAWKGWYSEMARKTAVNRLAKRLPVFVEVKSEDGRKTSVQVSAIPNEDTYYEGRVGNSVIDAPIDVGKPAEPENKMVALVAEALRLRAEYPEIYAQVIGKRDVTKADEEGLSKALERVAHLGVAAESQSQRELVEHKENEEDQLGF